LPMFFYISANSGRAKASVPPPAGKGTMIVTGLLGQAVCARTPQKAAAPAASISMRRDRPPQGGVGFIQIARETPGLSHGEAERVTR